MPLLPLKIVLHAPTIGSLARARNHLVNLISASPAPKARIVVNAEAVAATLDNPNDVADRVTQVCGNTLRKLNRQAPTPLTVLDQGAVLGSAEMQVDGWYYIRA